MTKSFIFKGKKLQLNVAAKGALRVALLDKKGKEIKGYGLADCDLIQSDAVRHTVTWDGKSDLGKLSGKTVRLNFEMQDAKLFALQFIE